MRSVGDMYLDLARLALETAVPGVVMCTIAPLAYRRFMRFHASHAMRSEHRSEEIGRLEDEQSNPKDSRLPLNR